MVVSERNVPLRLRVPASSRCVNLGLPLVPSKTSPLISIFQRSLPLLARSQYRGYPLLLELDEVFTHKETEQFVKVDNKAPVCTCTY